MPGQAPGNGQNPEQAAPSPQGQPRFAWVPGSVGAGPVPLTGVMPASEVPLTGGVPGGGRARVLDWQALLAALAAGGLLDGRDEDQDVVLADELAAEQDGRMGPPIPAGRLAGLAMEHMAPGPAMAGWLAEAVADVTGLDEYGLVGAMSSARQLASWAQAAELTAVAQLASVCAAADPDVGVQPDGRPVRVCRDVLGQVGLALCLSDCSAAAWIDLAVTLAWRLPATGAALAAGRVDLYRARLIAEATSVLGEDAARVAEAEVLPAAGRLAPAQLRRKLRRAVIAADPEAAEQRRSDAERRAAVSLYPDQDGTATLSGTNLPQGQAAAAMAKITAIAKAMKAAGWAGGLDLLRAVAMLGLLLGTLPEVPPPDGAPPDGAPPDSPPPPGDEPPGHEPPSHEPPGDEPPGDEPPGDEPLGDQPPGNERPGEQPPGNEPPGDQPPPGPGAGDAVPGPADPGPCPGDLPAPRDEDAPPDDGLDACGADGRDSYPGCGAADGDDDDPAGPVPSWPALGVIPPALARLAGEPDGRPPGLLDVTLPWATWVGLPGGGSGTLGRIGPITQAQARELARAAEHDPAAQWRIIITDPEGRAIAVARIPTRPARAGPSANGPPRHVPPPGPPTGTGLVGRVTLTISQDMIHQVSKGMDGRHAAAGRQLAPGGSGSLSPIAAATLRAAARALDRALAQAEADATANGCAHSAESAAYRPPPRLREFVIARDVTCRFLTCRQPAWRADLDHTIPYDQGGRTCSCNLGGGCRKHHILKQHRRWKLEQQRPGEFTWITPAGRRYTVEPDRYPL
jgi:hypothetical protein